MFIRVINYIDDSENKRNIHFIIIMSLVTSLFSPWSPALRLLVSGYNACYHSVQNLLSSRMLSKNIKFKIYKIMILTVVFYGCETWSLTLREERRMRVFETRMMRRMFGPKRDKIPGEWRKLYKEELSDFYSSPNIVHVSKSRRLRWAGHVALMGERILVVKPGGKYTTWKTQA